MRSVTTAIFGDPIPTAMLTLAQAVDRAIVEAEQSTDAIQDVRRRLKEVTRKLDNENRKRLDAEYLYPRNYGGHWYPYLGEGTSDCKYCKCWMGPSRSGGPEGVDQFGDCPGNPKLRIAYKLIQEEQATKAGGD